MSRSLLVVLLVLLAACSSPEAAAPGASSAGSTAAGTAPSTATGTGPSTDSGGGRPRSPLFDQALHDELIEMAERDQSGRTGGADPEGDGTRTTRLAEILDEHGWPTFDLVGEDGEDAAWLIAQHSDQDPALQRRALELLRPAVAAGQASPGNLAYLEDRGLEPLADYLAEMAGICAGE